MSVADDIKQNASDTFGSQWTVRDGQVVPNASDLKLSNDAVRFEKATILYADLDQSTDLVATKKWQAVFERACEGFLSRYQVLNRLFVEPVIETFASFDPAQAQRQRRILCRASGGQSNQYRTAFRAERSLKRDGIITHLIDQSLRRKPERIKATATPIIRKDVIRPFFDADDPAIENREDRGKKFKRFIHGRIMDGRHAQPANPERLTN